MAAIGTHALDNGVCRVRIVCPLRRRRGTQPCESSDFPVEPFAEQAPAVADPMLSEPAPDRLDVSLMGVPLR
jgi:hypothetical protein